MTSSTRARDELVFTNLEWPKVTPSQERSGRGRLSNFHCEWPHNSAATNVIAAERMTTGTDVSMSGGHFRSSSRGTWRAGTGAQEFILRILMGRSADKDGGEWTRHGKCHV